MAPKRKLTGAQARLFARICLQYMGDAEDGCNDKPDEVPIFSSLSKAQRLRLVSEVMIGVLCQDEPLPPDTIQHNATYRAMIYILFTQLEVESDTQYESDEVGDDLLNFDKKDGGSRRTSEEVEERSSNMALIEHRAERNMKRMQRQGVSEFHVEEHSAEVSRANARSAISSINDQIFLGGPVSAEERNSIRPLNEDEEYAFDWRRLCDAALQQDFTNPPFSLSMVNFDWRCQQLGKWFCGLNLLLDTKMMNYGSPTDRALIDGRIDNKSFADPDQLPRIRAIERHVDILKKVFQPTWDPKLLALDQRCIFAVCSTDFFATQYHKEWLIMFLTECEAAGIEFKEGGSFQERLDIFRKIKDDTINGCDIPYGCKAHPEIAKEGWAPGAQEPVEFFEKRTCDGPGKAEDIVNFEGSEIKLPGPGFCFKTENLYTCAKCKTAKYCSTECQRLHWPKHKKHCARLAAERKDKAKIVEMSKNI